MTGITDNPYPSGASTPTNQRSPAEAQGKVAAATSQAGDEAAGLKDEAVGAAADVKERAKAEVANVADAARAQARGMAGEVRERLDGQASDMTQRLASGIYSAADELRSMAAGSQRPESPIADVVRQVADRSEELARSLEQRGYRGMADDLARFGRNHAGAFLLAAGAAGFAVGRILRNTDTGAVVQAAKGELQGDDDTTTSAPRAEAAVMPGSGERPAEAAIVAETYEPVGSGLGSR